MLKPKKYAAEHIKIAAVYKTFTFMGNKGRYLEVAFPDEAKAKSWVEQQHDADKGNYIIEEMPAIMKAWQPYD